MRRRRTSSSPAGGALGGGIALGLTTAVLVAVVTLPLTRFVATAAVVSWPLVAGVLATVIIALGSPGDAERRRLAARARRDALSR